MNATVLVVDDNAVNRRVLRAILEGSGWSVVEAADGETALKRVRSEPPDLVLLDILMPGLDGYQVCNVLKSNPGTSEIPVIVVSSLADGSDRVRGLEAGAEDYSTKPFDPREVAVRVATHLRIRSLTRSLSERQRKLDEDLRAAAEIQRTLLPRSKTAAPGLLLSWLFEPCATIGGDVFNVIPLGENKSALYVVDVSGHGVTSALVTVSISQSLAPGGGIVFKPGTGSPENPNEVLAKLDREYPFERFESFFTIAYLTFDPRTGCLRYSSGGHPAPILLRKGCSPRQLAEGGTIIGIGDGCGFEEGQLVLEPGDRIALFTDGIPERRSPAGDMFGDDRLHQVFEAAACLSLDSVCGEVKAALAAHGCGMLASDDISLLIAEFKP